jgi:hypothetical protein
VQNDACKSWLPVVGAAVLVLTLDSVAWSQALNGPECLDYDQRVTLKGFYGEVVSPEQPNYESAKKGDAAVAVGILFLATPICTFASPDLIGEAV